MSALAAPQISLEQARQLVEYLENGEQEKADKLILETASKEQSELFAEVGKLTRQLHEALKNFDLDTRLTDLTTEAIPDAKQRLNYVMEMTESAANKTMDAVEASLPIAQQLADEIATIKPTWDRLMNREIELGEFKTLCHSLDKFMNNSHTKTDELQGLMTNVLMAQDYQDLTGQVIRRVIELVREVEDSLINLLTVFGSQDDGQIKQEKQAIDKAPAQSDTLAGPEGPIIDKESRDDVVSGQDEVDDLLSSLGF
ncbi:MULTISPECIES: protein phosphatase CheZ [Pseudoalteromonas]|jgi:chemotaxis protein CheZ|uniref:Protein phosphatase CheZ n=1 Tax=Pseudoalteromonas lipolytica TaxID=570156 RepID=A0AAD0RXX5_9GAMM|nr:MULTISPECIES: protein phosphatase CheZ [Pseudoalteromonas]AXV64655.1 protein phosphatase CheZ [Pseudoalteromonas donghaensis]EWH06108.1 protein phosphatase [Pseudoalteromonas lipolytica SCSIO 04301]MAE02148.1 protein phosphatase [Pseudoalteromonas sp.]MBE0351572.1 chemotaxis protein CheZ [Pseudoalteromonas lipolytica LMEB 39]MCC9661862.1 protein phosphatase CheZ [Pseudoalteromonas sp. MB41]|tara:strand:+ start:382 stop:1149 length:768 start_codon:yes stop_codon:yes gene_type:complete